MDIWQIIGLMFAAALGTAVALFRPGGKYNPRMPSLDREPLDEPYIPASPPPVMAPTATTSPATPVIEPTAPILPLDFSTPQKAFHSTRVMCDNAGLPFKDKNEMCYTIWGESQFHKEAIGKPNKNGTRDYGICQFNDGRNARGIPFWIGEGATFKDIDEVLTNPEKCVRVMIQTYKAGHIGWWYGHAGYTPERARTSPMWQLSTLGSVDNYGAEDGVGYTFSYVCKRYVYKAFRFFQKGTDTVE